MPWAALIAEIILGSIGIGTIAFTCTHQYDIISQIGLPIFIIFMAIYGPMVLLSILGIIAIVQGNAHGLRLNIYMFYIVIALMIIGNIINIIIMSTARRDEIIHTCQNANLKRSSNISYLINPIGTALTVDIGCRDYWIKFVLFYVVSFLGYLLIMVRIITFNIHTGTVVSHSLQVPCILTLRTYRKYLVDHHTSHDDVFGLKKSYMDSYPYNSELVCSERHAYEEPEIKYEKSFETRDGPPTPEVQNEYYQSRPELYSKISQKNDLRRESLTVPTTVPGKKSPTLERMDYERFKGRRSSNVPLERESSIKCTRDLGDSESAGLLHDSTK